VLYRVKNEVPKFGTSKFTFWSENPPEFRDLNSSGDISLLLFRRVPALIRPCSRLPPDAQFWSHLGNFVKHFSAQFSARCSYNFIQGITKIFLLSRRTKLLAPFACVTFRKWERRIAPIILYPLIGYWLALDGYM
jgi:hypothetical protein